MAVEPLYLSKLVCDGGCGSSITGTSAALAREVGAGEGWTFPNMRKSNGRPSKRVHDVCPSCRAGFTAKVAPGAAEFVGMSDEERHLTVFLRMHWNVVDRGERQRMEERRDALKAARLVGQGPR